MIESTLTHKINLLEQNFDNHLENVKKEREEILTKNENLIYEISDKNKDITTLNYKLQMLNASNVEKEDIFNKLKKNYESEKKDLIERLDQLKTK